MTELQKNRLKEARVILITTQAQSPTYTEEYRELEDIIILLEKLLGII